MTTHEALIADAYLRRRGQVGAGAVEEEAGEPGAGGRAEIAPSPSPSPAWRA